MQCCDALLAIGESPYGAWARYWEATSSVRDGQEYEEIWHYATLVFETVPGRRIPSFLTPEIAEP